ncbi:MAG: winged helix-turn-helix domain-containing protein [Nitrososphaera sp.]
MYTESNTRSVIQKRIQNSEHNHLVDLNTVKKILEILYTNGRVKRTHLSVKAGMNYERCTRYINILKLIKLVEVILENNSNYVIITQAGIEIINMLDYI